MGQCNNSIANTRELRLSCTNPSIYDTTDGVEGIKTVATAYFTDGELKITRFKFRMTTNVT